MCWKKRWESSRKAKRSAARSHRPGRPWLETLETRLTPTLITLASFGVGENFAAAVTDAGLIMDSSGNMYGTTYFGGTSNDGTVFELAKGSGTITTLASFNGTNGQNPVDALVMDSSGNLFGTASHGGPSNDNGTVFELAKGSGTITTLASFNGTTNGENPYAGLLMDSSGNLFGTTDFGGASSDGTVFELNSGKLTTLASFNGTNGKSPEATLIMDSSGNLYGTTSRGGASSSGTVYELAKGSGTLTARAFNGTTNGANPHGALVMDSSGNLYGTTTNGGASSDGTVFELAHSNGTLTTLASFNGANGQNPTGLIMDSSGNLYGSTALGGVSSDGTVFELSSGTLATLASFNGTPNGAMAHATLIMDSSGNLYGTTTSGGALTGGTIFQLERAAADFLVAGFPSPATAGVAHAFTVTAENGYGTVDSNYTGTVSFTSSDGQTVLPQAYTFTAADAGMHTFSGTFETAGTQSVTATDVNRSNLNGAQAGISVAPAAASKFVFSSVPAAATAGTAFNFTVTAEDPFNNTATAYAGTVAFTSSDGAAALPAASSLINGVGTFSATIKTAAAAGQTITATDTASVTGTSGPVPVSAAAATHFVVAAPGTAMVATAVNFTVTAQDQFDNTATGYTGNVNFTSSDGAAVLPANATLTNGVGTFSVTLDTAGSQKITATDTVTSSITGTSTAVVVSAGTTTISGTVFQEININGVQDPGEPGLAGETVFLDLSGTGTLATGDPSTTTDANGNYAFTVASPGIYTVRMVLLGGMLEDTPASGSYQVTVSGANVTGENFAIVPTSITVPLTLPPTSAFPAQGNAPADYVEAVFRAVLNRNADAGGLSFWTKQLNSGADTRLQVVQGIRNSLEHFGQEVDAFYQTLLSRPSDAGGRAFWVAQLENGLREEQIAFAFLNSPEYLSKGDKFFVDSMYQSLLGRPFDASGQAFWLGQLGDDAAGNPTGNPLQTHAQVVTDFLLSTESLQRLVEGYYEVFLQRQADAGGLNSWVSELQQGLPFLTIGEEFIASDEFFNKAAAHG